MKTYITNKPWHRCRAFGLLLLLGWMAGCDSFTETELPIMEMNELAVYEQRSTANAAMTDVYAKIRDNGMLTGKTQGLGKELGLYTDELQYWGTAGAISEYFFNNNLQPNNVHIAEWWNNAYTAIYGANAVMEGVAESERLLPADKDQLRGEALFARSLMHFYLLQLFGEVPYVTTTDYTVNIDTPRTSTAELYGLIIADLEEAALLLPEAYITEGRVRPNRFAALALLARVYMFNGQWAEASNTASAVLNQTELYVWPVSPANTFLKGSTTAIWQYSPRTATRNTDDAGTMTFNAGPPPLISLSSSLMAAFEPGDLRRTEWIRTITNGTGTWYHAYKYKRAGATNPQHEYTVVLRLAEQYLIRAEARARQGELIGAVEDLNRVRNRAGLGNTDAVDQQGILEAILRERRVEFFTEFGHRFMDLKRTGELDTVLQGKAGWDTTDRLVPIPQAELDMNPRLQPQNPGY